MFASLYHLVVNMYRTVGGKVNIAYYNVLYRIHGICYDEVERLFRNFERDSTGLDSNELLDGPMVSTRCRCYYCRRNSCVSEMSILDRTDAQGDVSLI